MQADFYIPVYKDTDSVNFLGILLSFKLVQLPSIYEYFIIIIIKLFFSLLSFLKKVHRFQAFFGPGKMKCRLEQTLHFVKIVSIYSGYW